MWNIIKQIFLFRVAQNSTRGVARMVGFGRLGVILGIVGGIRAVMRQRRAY
jgi:glucose uptake protein GlcU